MHVAPAQDMAAAVIHAVDLHVIKGEQPFPFPCVLGHEVTGEVVEHGPNTDPATVERLPVGMRVVSAFIMPCGGCFFCLRGQEDLCETFFKFNRGKGTLYDGTSRLYRRDGTQVFQYSMGGLAEYCVAPATCVAALPAASKDNNNLYVDGAVLGCAAFTAYGALRNAADFRAGETIAIIGTGGVGSFCVQIARVFGAERVIAVDISDGKLEAAQGLGATDTVNAKTENVVDKIMAITGGRGVDVALEALGRPDTFQQAVKAVRDGGRAVMVGIAPVGVTAAIEITRLVRRKISIIGSYGARARADLPAVARLAASGAIDVSKAVTQRFKLEEADWAYKLLDRHEITGRAVVQMR
eukprot:jgi/Chlat1/2602/Chrsp178S02453